MEEFIQRAERRKKIVSPFIAELLDYEATQTEDICSNFIKLSMVYQCHLEDLEQVIEKRKAIDKKFTENEIFFLVECIASALIKFDSYGIKHADIRPATILVSSEGQCKLTDV